nr:immunoglobulin heavy chain junction region [Mus musculus]
CAREFSYSYPFDYW